LNFPLSRNILLICFFFTVKIVGSAAGQRQAFAAFCSPKKLRKKGSPAAGWSLAFPWIF
jgi:hypothetical protein